MFIDLTRNNGKKYLRLADSVRVVNKDGFKVPKKVVLLNLGPLDKYDDGQPDYIGRLRESFRNGNPLIDALLPYVDKNKLRKEYRFSFFEGEPRQELSENFPDSSFIILS